MKTVDLFCGGGGATDGAEQAGCEVIVAANHSPLAIEIHAANHPRTKHLCQDLQQLDWSVLPDFDLLLASPACQGHIHARGKERPHHDSTRSTAWAVVAAREHHLPDEAVVENVREFLKWKLFPAWCAAISALGYVIAPHLLDAADFGVPRHRKRVFIILTKSKHPLKLKLERREHVPASSFIDFDAGTWTAIEKPGRSTATIARTRAGRAAFGDRFIAPYLGNGSGLTGRCLSRPIGTITTRDRWAVIDGNRMWMVMVDEARAAMSFRADYKLPLRKRDAMHMLGNAVCPFVERDVILALKEAA